MFNSDEIFADVDLLPTAQPRRWADNELIFGETFEKPVCLLKIGDIPLLTVGNIATIKGAPKTKKSFFVSMLISSFFGNDSFRIGTDIQDGRCLLIDSEQSRDRATHCMSRVYRLGGWAKQNPNFRALSLREYDPNEILNILTEAVEDFKPNLIILDGLLDFTNSVNDESECVSLVQTLSTISTNYQCGIVSVLHTGKISGQMLGWLGSILQRKSESVIELIKGEDETTTVKPNECRHLDFNPFCFFVNGEGLPMLGYVEPKQSAEEKQSETLRFRFEQIMTEGKTYSYSELINSLINVYQLKSSGAEKNIRQAIGFKIIEKTIGKAYYLNPK